MSVDQRIRQGLHATSAQLLEPDSIGALGAVTQGSRRASRRRGLAAGGMAALAAAAAVVLALGVTYDDGSAGPSLPTDQSPSLSPDPATADLAHAYTSDAVNFVDMAQNLRAHELGEWVEPLRAMWGDVEGQIRLEVARGQLTASIPGTPARHSSSGYAVYPAVLSLEEVDADFKMTFTELHAGRKRLTLTLMRSEAPPIDRVPGEVVLRALYTTASFREVLPHRG